MYLVVQNPWSCRILVMVGMEQSMLLAARNLSLLNFVFRVHSTLIFPRLSWVCCEGKSIFYMNCALPLYKFIKLGTFSNFVFMHLGERKKLIKIKKKMPTCSQTPEVLWCTFVLLTELQAILRCINMNSKLLQKPFR